MSIKRGVHFYSYQDKQFLGEFGLEECMKAASETGATGFELMPEQTRLGHFPNYTDEEVGHWFYLLDKYKLEPIDFVGFVDSPRRGKPDLPLDELVKQNERYIKICKQFKVPMLQVGFGTHQYKELIARSAPIAEEHGIKLAFVLGLNTAFSKEKIQEYIDLIEKGNNKHVGFLLDFSLFSRRPSPSLIAQLLRNGADKPTIDYILNSFEAGMDRNEIMSNVTFMVGADRFSRLQSEITYLPGYYRKTYSRPERALASFGGPCGAGVSNLDPAFIRDIAKYIFLCWGKCYDMTEDYVEPNIDYEAPISILKECNWDGYITTMYEGQRNFHDANAPYSADEVEAVRRHQEMLKRLLEN